jgi:hypothetical protein
MERAAFFLIGGLAGAHWVGQTSRCNALLKAGGKLGIVQGIVNGAHVANGGSALYAVICDKQRHVRFGRFFPGGRDRE